MRSTLRGAPWFLAGGLFLGSLGILSGNVGSTGAVEPAAPAAPASQATASGRAAAKPAGQPASDAAPKTDPKPDSVDQDYSGELPRIPPLEPRAALDAFQVARGFRIEQVAAEPLVTDPVAMAFDENGRLFVIEMRDYSEDDKANLGRIRVLDDTDGDGRFDRSSILVDGLSWPTAIACYDGGVFVAAAPEFFYFKDTDGDGKADVRKHLFTGFARSNVQGLVNSFQWSLDNRYYVAVSSSGAAVAPAADFPGASGEAPKPAELVLRGRDFAFNPRNNAIEPVSGGGQHGASFDNWGRRFLCNNSDHLQQVMFEDRYIARNAYSAAPSPRLSIAADGPQADVFRTSDVEPWRIVRTRLRAKGVIPGVVEGGGRAAGYFTSATGITIYRGSAWPAEFSGLAIVGDVGGNLIHRKRLESNGVPLVGRRIDEKSELVSSKDIWFRPVQFANAPDGALYVADMYREVIEHPASLHPVIKKHLDLTSGRDRGRIYRIVPDGFQSPPPPQLGKASVAELVATLAHPNGWHRDTAARLLFTRQDRSAVPALEKLSAASTAPEGRLHALYALAGLDALTPDVVAARLLDEHPRVRQHAIRLAERLAADSPPLRERLAGLVADPDLEVRYQLAFSLGELPPGPQRYEALARLARRDFQDSWMRLALRSSLAEGAGEVLGRLATDESLRSTKVGRDFLQAIAEQIGKQQRADDVAALLGLLAQLPAQEKETLQALLQGLAAKPGSKLADQVAAATGGRAAELTRELIASSAKTAVDAQAPTAERVAAVQQLRLGRFAELRDTIGPLLDPAQPADIQTAALAVLASFRDPEVGALLVDRWSGLSPRVRAQAADVLFSRTEWAPLLLDAVASGTVPPGDVEASRWKLLAEQGPAELREKAAKLAAKLQVGRRADVLEAYRGVADLTGDVGRGKELFKKVCSACHQVQGVGHPTGPNLAAIKNRGDDAILVNVLDPNREVNPQYLNYTLVTTDGRTLSGMIAAETATSVTLKRADNASDVVLRIDIEQMRSSGMSLMPEGLEKQIDKQQMADLIAYLKSID